MKRLRDWYAGLAERERKLLAIFGAVLLVFLLVLIPYGASALLGSDREYNESLRRAIASVQRGKGKLEQIKQRKESVERRYVNPAPALAGFIENAARQKGLEIPESQDRAEVPHGKRFLERTTVVRLRKVGMLPLVQMLESLENAGHPIVISRLNLRKRARESDSYDVELGVSAFDKVQTKAKAASGTTGDSQ